MTADEGVAREELVARGPANVPPDFTAPSSAYRRHAYLALAGLLGFVAIYVAFGLWLARTTWHLAKLGFQEGSGWALLAAAMSGLLTLFLFKALVFLERGSPGELRELTAAEQPRLFAFLRQLADEAGAPRPRHVYVSHEVNASVFYDLSLLNLLFPSHKNLVIGLGLVNALTVSELRAVLAHEFGHFTQRTMAIGRYVYIARQVAAQIVFRRDALDSFLTSLSSFDPRVGWIGWVLRLIIWAIRAVADTLFRVVIAAQRALGREMEDHADRVSVALAGSDAPVHALHRLGPADAAFDHAVSFLEQEGRAGRAVIDLFAVQEHTISRMREVLDDPLYGKAPPLPEHPEQHRLFRARLAHPPKMWATHPPNEDREQSCKRVYLAAPLDDRSAWVLFDEPARLRAEITAALYVEGKRPPEAPQEETFANLDRDWSAPYLDPRYRGVYLSRSPLRGVERIDELLRDPALSADLDADRHRLVDALAALYPTALRDLVAKRRELAEELGQLEAVKSGALQATGGVLRHRGQEHRRRELPALIARTRAELDEIDGQLAAHDRRCRATHLAAARAQDRELGLTADQGWESALRGLVALAHYATHREANLDDAIGALGNVVSVVTADGRVSRRERNRVLAAAMDLYLVLRQIHEESEKIELGAALATKLETTSWHQKLGGALELPAPDEDNLGQWLGAVGSWSGSASNELAVLRRAALAELLRAEAQVAAATCGDGPTAPPVTPLAAVRLEFRWFPVAAERPRQTRLGWWDRFMVADGYVPATIRLAVAGGIVGSVMWMGNVLEKPAAPTRSGPATLSMSGPPVEISIYNGLERAVVVHLGDYETAIVGPGDERRTVLPAVYGLQVRTSTEDGEVVERLSPTLSPGRRYFYNVAGAAPLFSWRRLAGTIHGAPRVLGATPWTRIQGELWLPSAGAEATDGDDVERLGPARIEDAPELSHHLPETAQRTLALAHARWDAPDSPRLQYWLERAAVFTGPSELRELLTRRLSERPGDVGLRTLALRAAPDRDQACAEARDRAAAGDDDDRYLAARCDEPSDDALAAQAEAHPQHVYWNLWWAERATRARRWGQARDALERVTRAQPHPELAVELARLRRVAALEKSQSSDDVDLSDLVESSLLIRSLLAVPRPTDVPPSPVAASLALREGAIARALELAERDDELALYLPLAAASDGADDTLVARTLARPLAELTAGTVAARLGLELRRDAGSAATQQLLAALRTSEPALAEFVAPMAAGRLPDPAALRGAALATQGHAYTVAVIALGRRCPPPWRALAKALLFPRERPYLR